MRQHLRFFLFVTLLGIALRLLAIFCFPGVTTDSFIYGDIAKNWLRHGIYGLTGSDAISATYIRLPGYPAFLAAVFAVSGVDHYRSVLFTQVFVDIGTCFLIADIARRLISEQAARVALLLAALCPFLAQYVAAALTESLEIFFTSLALDLALIAFDRPLLRLWFTCGLAIGAAVLLRPDGGLLLIAIAGYVLVIGLTNQVSGDHRLKQGLLAACILTVVALAPLIPWTRRNLHVFHRFQPLAPRYANEENEFVPMGFNRWVKTWIADYSSVEEIYWAVPGSRVDAAKLPSRAFDSEAERERTFAVLTEYNKLLHISPRLDAQFESLAQERITHAPLRYYLWLPALRIADMWLRPRTATLPCDTRWWEFNDDPQWSVLAISLAVVNLAYVLAALYGSWRVDHLQYAGLLLTFVVLRSLFLGTLENPEPRYTLECYPVVIVLASAVFVGAISSPSVALAEAETILP